MIKDINKGLSLEWPLMKDSIDIKQKNKIKEFLDSKDVRLTSGKKVREFEEAWSKWLGVKYSCYVNSGGSANLLLLDCVKELFFSEETLKERHIGESSSIFVLVPSCTWGTSIAPLMQCGYSPVYCDIDLETYSFDEACLEKIKNDLDKGWGDKHRQRYNIDIVWITHLMGSPSNIERIKKYFPNAMILEDCCESHGAKASNATQKIGTLGKGSTFSFYFGHHMTTVEGGMVSTDDKHLYNMMRMKRSHGLAREALPEYYSKYIRDFPEVDKRFLFPVAGYNFRNQEINAVIGLEQLKNLDKWIKIRQENLHRFNRILLKCNKENKSNLFKPVKEKGNSSYALAFVCCSPDLRTSLDRYLTTHYKFETRPFIAGNILRQPFIYHKDPYSFKNAEFLHKNALYIGNNQFLTKENFDILEDILLDFTKEYRKTHECSCRKT